MLRPNWLPAPLLAAAFLLSASAALAGPDDEVIATLKKRMASFKLCHDDAIKRRGYIEGKVVVAFEVGPDGRVTTSRVAEDTLKDPEVGCCAALTVRKIKYPEPENAPLKVSYPFVFVDPNKGARPPARPPEPTTYCAQLRKADGVADPAPAAPPAPAPAPR